VTEGFPDAHGDVVSRSVTNSSAQQAVHPHFGHLKYDSSIVLVGGGLPVSITVSVLDGPYSINPYPINRDEGRG
jgi:hypothetical protein